MGSVGGLTLVASLAVALSHRTSASRPPLSSRSTLPRKVWVRATHKHLAEGGTAQDVAVARDQTLAALQAVVVRCTANALLRLQTDPNHPPGLP